MLQIRSSWIASLEKVVQVTSPAQIAGWLSTEAPADTVVGISGKIAGPLLAALTEQGYCSGEQLIHPSPGRYWVKVDLPKALRGKHQQQAILCANLAAQWWQGLRFVFYTNYGSRKGRELDGNSRAALVFYWPQLSRQVRVTGGVEKTSRSDSEAYFKTRPRGAQLAAWASWQSSPIPDREVLEARVRKMDAKYAGVNVPLPPKWGGYRLRPDSIEFWQGRPSRLHDRLRYTRGSHDLWEVERLAP